MNAEAHVDALVAQQLGDLAHRCLRLGDRHAVARHDDHRTRILHDERGIFGAAGLDYLVAHVGCSSPAALTEPTEDHRDERAVHRLAHDVAQDRT